MHRVIVLEIECVGMEENAETQQPGAEQAEMAVANARSLLSDFEEVGTEIKYGSIKHAIDELENARRALPDDY